MNNRIFLTGASGFVGGHLLQKLVEDGYQVTCLLRKKSAQKMRAFNFPNVEIVVGDFGDVESWEKNLKGHDIFINTVGIIRDTKKASFKNIHQDAPVEIFKKCKTYDFKKIIQLSALGADAGSASKYHLSKKAADDFLKNLGVDYAILRPSFIYGPGDQSMTFFASLAILPIHFLPSHGNFRMSPIYINDLVRIFMNSITKSGSSVIDIGGAETFTFKELLIRISTLLGYRNWTQIPVPAVLINLACSFTDKTKWGPINSDEWSMLQRENFCNAQIVKDHFGWSPCTFEDGIRRANEVSSYHYSALKWLVPFLRWCVAFIWIHTGIISLFFTPKEYSLQLLSNVGVVGGYAEPILYLTAGFEVVLGLLILAKKMPGLLTFIQVALMFGFTLILSVKSPEFWIHPFGPLSKNIPLLAGILFLWIFEKKNQSEAC